MENEMMTKMKSVLEIYLSITIAAILLLAVSGENVTNHHNSTLIDKPLSYFSLGAEADKYATKVLQAKTDNEFTVQVDEVLADKDYLYLTLTRQYRNLQDYFVIDVDDDDAKVIYIRYHGTLSDGKEELYFSFNDSDRIGGYEGDNSNDVVCYRADVPELLRTFGILDKELTCKLSAEIYLISYDVYKNDVMSSDDGRDVLGAMDTFATMDFDFTIAPSAVLEQTHTYQVNHRFGTKKRNVELEELTFSPFDISAALKLNLDLEEEWVFLRVYITDENGNELYLNDMSVEYEVDSDYYVNVTYEDAFLDKEHPLSDRSAFYNIRVEYCGVEDGQLTDSVQLGKAYTFSTAE